MNNEQNYAFKRIEIGGYKSIQDVVVEDISPLMVLAGSNGAGKSNFVDSLKILSELLTQNVEKVSKNSNFNTPNISILVKNTNIEYKIITENNLIKYENLNFSLNNEFYQYPKDIFEAELTDINETISNINDIIEKINKNSNSKNEEKDSEINELIDLLKKIDNEKKYDIKAEKLRSENFSFTQIYEKELNKYKEINEFLSTISNISIFRIDPIQAKKPSIDNSTTLKSDGSNIASVLVNLESDDELRETILDWLSLIVPEMQHIKTDNRPIDGSKMLEFTEESGKKFPAHLVSDGTIYALCMLVAILTRTKKAGITIIEEPERGLHPKAIGELIGFMREYASISHPIILTTHSESVVRELELNELFFVSKENGKTKIKSVKDSDIDKNIIPLDEAWLTNMLNGGLPW